MNKKINNRLLAGIIVLALVIVLFGSIYISPPSVSVSSDSQKSINPSTAVSS